MGVVRINARVCATVVDKGVMEALRRSVGSRAFEEMFERRPLRCDGASIRGRTRHDERRIGRRGGGGVETVGGVPSTGAAISLGCCGYAGAMLRGGRRDGGERRGRAPCASGGAMRASRGGAKRRSWRHRALSLPQCGRCADALDGAQHGPRPRNPAHMPSTSSAHFVNIGAARGALRFAS